MTQFVEHSLEAFGISVWSVTRKYIFLFFRGKKKKEKSALALRCSHYPLMYLFLKFLKTPSVGRQTARNFDGTAYSGCPMAYTEAHVKYVRIASERNL